ncbi:MAG: transglycosylase SLT domain-containing protein [Betaproteobacteria bacterium]|nr:transglycosylase SLT domain-containing protein [Betaproteobacteria bacterium]
MSQASRAGDSSQSVASPFVNLVHGGVVALGLMAAVVLAGQSGNRALPGGEWQQWVSGIIARPVVEAKVEEPPEIDEFGAGSLPRLKATLRPVVEYLAQRYRVSDSAMERLVAAAHLAAGRFELDPLLIISVMAIESSFNPFAESGFGAQGLMQVVPRFHPEKLREFKSDNPLLDPVANIHIGARVLKEYIQRTGGVRAGLQQYGGASNDPEARYAAKVMAERQRLLQALGRRT